MRFLVVWKELLSKNGVFVYEDPYLGDVLAKTSFDQIYDEHVFYFQLTRSNILRACMASDCLNANLRERTADQCAISSAMMQQKITPTSSVPFWRMNDPLV